MFILMRINRTSIPFFFLKKKKKKSHFPQKKNSKCHKRITKLSIVCSYVHPSSVIPYIPKHFIFQNLQGGPTAKACKNCTFKHAKCPNPFPYCQKSHPNAPKLQRIRE